MNKPYIRHKVCTSGMSAILHDNKKTVFLAHTVYLVTQQAKFIKENTPLTVRYFIGGSFFLLAFFMF